MFRDYIILIANTAGGKAQAEIVPIIGHVDEWNNQVFARVFGSSMENEDVMLSGRPVADVEGGSDIRVSDLSISSLVE
jgi:hypothetical protein